MKKLSVLILIAALGVGLNLQAQELPQPSPAAKVEQRVGLTDITIEYSRPGVKERKIWGDLVPYDKLWRTGANKATAITFSDDVTVEGKKVPAGSYALYTIPGKDTWKIIFNSETESWGTGNYDEAKNVATISVKPKMVNNSLERMRFTIENITDDGAEVMLAWEKARVSFKVGVDVDSKAWSNIMEAIQNTEKDKVWRVYRNGANYCVDANKELEKAKTWIEKSIELKDDSWYSYWVQADVYAALGDKKGAIKSAKKAIDLGEAQAKEKEEEFTYKGQLEKSIEEWKK